MLLVLDPSTTATALTAGALACPDDDCRGILGPWDYARTRWLRLDAAGRTSAHRPRRARCRACGRTHVLVPARGYPRRPDTVETAGAALLAAARGLGHRRVADEVGLPASTVRGWLQRARVNSETIRVNATIAAHALDPMLGPIRPTGSPLGDMVEAVAVAVAAHVRRLGPTASPWQLAVAITGAGVLAPRPRRIAWYPNSDPRACFDAPRDEPDDTPDEHQTPSRPHATCRRHPHPACRPTHGQAGKAPATAAHLCLPARDLVGVAGMQERPSELIRGVAPLSEGR